MITKQSVQEHIEPEAATSCLPGLAKVDCHINHPNYPQTETSLIYMICLPNYQIIKLQNYQATKLPSYQVTKLIIYPVTKLPSFQVK